MKRYTPDDSPTWGRGTERRSLRLTPRDREAVENVRARYTHVPPPVAIHWQTVALLVGTWLAAGAWLLWMGY